MVKTHVLFAMRVELRYDLMNLGCCWINNCRRSGTMLLEISLRIDKKAEKAVIDK